MMNNTIQTENKVSVNRYIAAVLALLMVLFAVPLSVLADSYSKQGDALKIHMVDPSADYITTSRLSNGDYLNTISIAYDSNAPVRFTIDIGDGDGTNHLNVDEFKNYVKVFTSEALSGDSLVYTFGTDDQLTMEDIGTQTSLNRGRKFALEMTGLEKGKDYYLAFLSGLSSSQRGAELGSNSVIFKFSTLEDANKVNMVTLDHKSLILDGLGQSVSLKATVFPEGAANKSVMWSSSEPSVATVDATGKVTGLKEGAAVIKVTTVDGEKTATCPVTVRSTTNARVLSLVSGTQTLASEAKFTIDSPTVYQDLATKRYVVPEVQEQSSLPAFRITMIPNGGRKGTVFNTHVYADAALTQEVANGSDGITADIPDYTCGTFTIDNTKLEGGKTYYFTLDKQSTCGGAPLGEDVVIEFSVDGEAPTTEPEEPTTEPTTEPEEPSTEPEEPTTEPVTEPEEPSTEPEEPSTEPEEPTTEPTTEPAVEPRNGLVKNENGVWTMYADDVVLTSYNGLVKCEEGWLYVENGYVTGKYTGFAKNANGWWRVKNSKVDFSANSIYKQPANGKWYKTTNGKILWNETGVFKNENGWWRVKDSRVDFNANGIYKNENGWWKTTNGKVTFKENGVFKNENGWWKVKNSKVDFSFTGIASNQNGTWYLKKGKVDFSKNGKVTYNGKAYTVTNGRAKLS